MFKFNNIQEAPLAFTNGASLFKLYQKINERKY